MSDLNERLEGKRIFISSGTPAGKITLIAECGRVMDVVAIDEVTNQQLSLTDSVALNDSDAQQLLVQADKARHA